jgi:TM2 domain-containing membrane protein YozV
VLAVLGDTPVSAEVAARLAPLLGPAWADAVPASPVRASALRRFFRYKPSNRRIGALVCFPEDRARVLPVVRFRLARDGKPWRQALPGIVARMYRPLHSAWRDAIDCLGARDAQAPSRSRAAAIVLALFVGWSGAHWFYLGRRRRGVTYVILLPLLLAPLWLAWTDVVRFLWVDRLQFERRFVGPVATAADPVRA